MPPIETYIIDNNGTKYPLTAGGREAIERAHLTTQDKQETPYDLEIISLPRTGRDRTESYLYGNLARPPRDLMSLNAAVVTSDQHSWGNLEITAVNGTPFEAPKPHQLLIETSK